jgi:hypothetical protein
VIQAPQDDQYEREGDLKAIWIASCLDENHIMYYKSVQETHKISDIKTVQEYVTEWRELFRPGIEKKHWINGKN